MNHIKAGTVQLVCKRIVLILMHGKNCKCCYFSTIILAHTDVKPLQNPPVSLQTNVIFGRQGKCLLFCVVAMLEPVMPSLNHITKLAQMRNKT